MTLQKRPLLALLFLVLPALLLSADSVRGDDALATRAAAAMRRAAEYYRNEIALHGGYVYYYSPDLTRRLGEGVASDSQIWVQPPGTPTVGMAMLSAYRATGDRFYLEAAQEAAEALIYGQLQSGGWTNSIDFDPQGRTAKYRNGRGRGKDHSSLDDGITEAAIRLLMNVDEALQFQNQKIHSATMLALTRLLEAQFPNGAFPQVWTDPVDSHPVLRASYPEYDWRTEGRIKNYWDMYTLNDGVSGQVASTLEEAYRIYKDPKYLTALKKLGEFLVLAQMPEPQPAWAQQYNYEMKPIWARKFEPPAIAARESEDAVETLMRISEVTGDRRFLEPIPRALKYLESSALPDGRLARYYELRTNRPLYMSRRGDIYKLTYDDSRLPSHYGWKNESRVDELRSKLQRLQNGGSLETAPSDGELAAEVERIVEALDDDGRWVTTFEGQLLVGQPKFREGERFLSSAVFSQNLETLSRYLRRRQ